MSIGPGDPILTEDGYRAALAEVQQLMDAEPGTPEGERLDALATSVVEYELTALFGSQHMAVSITQAARDALAKPIEGDELRITRNDDDSLTLELVKDGTVLALAGDRLYFPRGAQMAIKGKIAMNVEVST